MSLCTLFVLIKHLGSLIRAWTGFLDEVQLSKLWFLFCKSELSEAGGNLLCVELQTLTALNIFNTSGPTGTKNTKSKCLWLQDILRYSMTIVIKVPLFITPFFFFSKLRPNSRKCFAPLLSGLDRSYFPFLIEKKTFFSQLAQSSNPTRQNQMCPSNAHAWTHTNLQGLAA